MATLFRKNEELHELQREAVKALQVGAIPHHGPVELQEEENYVMLVGEERVRLQPHALEDPQVQHLIKTIIKWVNETLEDRRIIIRDIAEDFYDGQVLSELLEVLTGQKFMAAGVTMSVVLQKAKLKTVLDKIDRILQIHPDDPVHKWNVESIHSKDVVSILHLLVALASYYRCKHHIPQNVKIKRIYLKQHQNRLETKLYEEEITSRDYGPRAPEPSADKDVFDKLFSEAPEKLEAVKRSLCQFASKVLAELDILIMDPENQFHNGVNFILLMGILEGYFVPLYLYHLSPTTVDQKINNVQMAFKLMGAAGLAEATTKINPQDVVQRDLKSILRVLYAIFTKYKAQVQAGTVGPPTRPISTVST
ncbi:PREDICTED: alpha-parvin-like [Amphimedon queenslandica]|uniref:Calponin-homology (CH) domain-containing protein n=1 Tax=Amphimedon queenslandica TaxID=400682 RepID=A0A1X7TH98_AMPQE|nr:PREDICTED: alpha-parvin-like [Amphimedon queenslandica]|eukprot:XP_003390571.1 PREDICTED: alpha-parvin-like [Amphimedon queenslandica]